MARGKNYNPRLILNQTIRFLEGRILARESDSTIPFPTLVDAEREGVIYCSRATFNRYRELHTDLDARIRELLEQGPFCNSGKGQAVSPPGVSPEKAAAIKATERHRDETLDKFTPLVNDYLEDFLAKANRSDNDTANIVVKIQSNLAKGWKKDVEGRLDHTHKHNHYHQLADDLASMTPEQLAEFEREAVRDINGFDEQERAVKALRPKTQVLEAGVRDVERVN